MGLLKTVTSNSGIEVTNAYHRIDFINGDQDNVEFFITAYPSYNFFNLNKSAQPLTTIKYTFKPDVNDDAINLFKQSYAYLKSLDEYKNTEDVLESGQSPI